MEQEVAPAHQLQKVEEVEVVGWVLQEAMGDFQMPVEVAG